MQDATDERRVIYGLRDKATGLMLRVESEADLTGDNESPSAEIIHKFTTDPGYPLFDAGSAERLACVFALPYPGSADNPYRGDHKSETVEPVVIEEIVTRTVRPSGQAFDIPLRIQIRYAVDMDRRMARSFEGADEILDAVDTFREEIIRQDSLGSGHAWGSYRMVGLVVLEGMENLPEGYQGRLVIKHESDLPVRALTAIPLSDKLIRMFGGDKDTTAGSVILCLSDMRQAPKDLLDKLRDLAIPKVPVPS